MAKREAIRKARELREEFRARGEFTQGEYLAELKTKLTGLSADIFNEAVEAIAEKIDRESADDMARRLGKQKELFELDGEYRLGEHRRVAKMHATIEHARAALKLAEDNVEAVREAYQRRKDELDLLEPYWGPGMSKGDAVDAYRAANPDDEVA